ncbi:MAG: hypothetical protein WCW25_02100 [Patescibacteria group bacterium]
MERVFVAENKEQGFFALLRIIFELPTGSSKEAGPDQSSDVRNLDSRSQNKTSRRWKISRVDEPW